MFNETKAFGLLKKNLGPYNNADKLANSEQFWSTHGKRSILFYYFLTPRLEKILNQIIWKEKQGTDRSSLDRYWCATSQFPVIALGHKITTNASWSCIFSVSWASMLLYRSTLTSRKIHGAQRNAQTISAFPHWTFRKMTLRPRM